MDHRPHRQPEDVPGLPDGAWLRMPPMQGREARVITRWTMPDIARELDLRVETVHGYRSRQQMPEPTGVIGRTPYWTDAAIGPWIERQKARRKHKGQA